MKTLFLPASLLASALVLSGCVIDAGEGAWEERVSLEERTRLAIEACGVGKVAEVDSDGFECLGADD